MELTWLIGFTVGLFIVGIVCLITEKKNKKQGISDNGYDERQVAARGKCYQTAFLSVFFLEVALGVLDVALDSPAWMQGSVLHMLVVFFGATIFACMAINNDAYFRPSDKTVRAIVGFFALGVISILLSAKRISEGRFFTEAGQLGSLWYNLLAGIFLFTVAICMLVKQIKEKKAADVEDNAE